MQSANFERTSLFCTSLHFLGSFLRITVLVWFMPSWEALDTRGGRYDDDFEVLLLKGFPALLSLAQRSGSWSKLRSMRLGQMFQTFT
jgi:hypothetical protein